jgi:hypothetical protein
MGAPFLLRTHRARPAASNAAITEGGFMSPNYKRTPRLIALFLLGIVLLNYPLLSLFNQPLLICGIPLLYGYIFVVWALLIALVRLTVGSSKPLHSKQNPALRPREKM